MIAVIAACIIGCEEKKEKAKIDAEAVYQS